jgi:hypothetical protein
MTDKQMDLIRKQLPARSQVPWKEWTEEQKKINRELSCIDMINSILAYNWFGEDAEWVMQYEEKAYKNYLAEYVELFGRDKVVELIQAQIDSIDNIKRRVYTDNEGVSYNSIIWIDD